MLRDHLNVEMWTEVELPDEALAAEALIADSRAPKGNLAGSQIVGGRLSYHGVEPDALDSQLAGIKSLAPGKEPGIGVGSGRQVHVAITRAEKCARVAGTVVRAVAHHFQTELVVAHLAEDVAIAHRDEVVELVDAAVPSKGQDALFGK